jgi:hypothetical protein
MINRYSRSLICLLSAAACASAAPPAPPAATTQSLEQRMIDLAPVLSIDDPRTKSLDVQAKIDTGGPQFFARALYEAPDRHAIYFSDPRDGTPLCIVAEDRLIIYDPIDGVLRVAEKMSGALTLAVLDGKLNLNFGFQPLDKQPWAIKFDVPSLLENVRTTAVEDLGGGIYGLRQRTPSGRLLYAAIDPRRPCPYLRLEMLSGEKGGLFIDPIRRNEPIDPAAFDVPSNAQLGRRMPVKPFPGDGFFGRIRASHAFMQILSARFAVDDPQLRANLGPNEAARIDWAKVKANDAKFAPVLRELFPLATAAPSGGAAPATKPASDSNGPATNRAP